MRPYPTTPQEVYDYVAAHLLTQNAKAQGEIGSANGCLYRAPEGRKCAAGCLIPDDLYTPAMEGRGIADSIVAEGLERVPQGALGFLRSAQLIHDHRDPPEWRDALIAAGAVWGFDATEATRERS